MKVKRCRVCQTEFRGPMLWCSSYCMKTMEDQSSVIQARKNEKPRPKGYRPGSPSLKKARKLGWRKEKRERISSLNASNSFYSSPEWRRVRYRALVEFGRQCRACGSVKQPFHVDHIKPRSKYPELSLEISNLQILCEPCNMGKGSWDQTDWRSTDTPLTTVR